MKKYCSECENGENYEVPAEFKISIPNDDKPGLRVIKNVCLDHYIMLIDDYGNDLKVIKKY